jgi:hypothetical protein
MTSVRAVRYRRLALVEQARPGERPAPEARHGATLGDVPEWNQPG